MRCGQLGTRKPGHPVAHPGVTTGVGSVTPGKSAGSLSLAKRCLSPIYITQTPVLCVLVKDVSGKLSFQPAPLKPPFHVNVFEILLLNSEVFQTRVKSIEPSWE